MQATSGTTKRLWFASVVTLLNTTLNLNCTWLHLLSWSAWQLIICTSIPLHSLSLVWKNNSWWYIPNQVVAWILWTTCTVTLSLSVYHQISFHYVLFQFHFRIPKPYILQSKARWWTSSLISRPAYHIPLVFYSWRFQIIQECATHTAVRFPHLHP